MSGMRVEMNEPDQVSVTDDDTGARWVFLVKTNDKGRRGLDGPHGAVNERHTYAPDQIRQATVLAHSEALHAGITDY